MRFQVPQFVDIEDRIIGPLTLKMFGYYAVAGMLLFPLYVLLDLSAFITVALPVLGFAALFAHVKIHGQSLVRVVWYAVIYYTSPHIYLWQRGGGQEFPLLVRGEEFAEWQENGALAAPSLDVIAEQLNTHGNVSVDDAPDPMLEDAVGT